MQMIRNAHGANFPDGWEYTWGNHCNHNLSGGSCRCPVCKILDNDWHYRRGLCLDCYSACLFLIRDDWNKTHDEGEKMTLWDAFLAYQELSNAEWRKWVTRTEAERERRGTKCLNPPPPMSKSEFNAWITEHDRKYLQQMNQQRRELMPEMQWAEGWRPHEPAQEEETTEAEETQQRIDEMMSELDEMASMEEEEEEEEEVEEEKMKKEHTDEELLAMDKKQARELTEVQRTRRKKLQRARAQKNYQERCKIKGVKDDGPFFEPEQEEQQETIEVTAVAVTQPETEEDMRKDVVTALAEHSAEQEEVIGGLGMGDGFFYQPKPMPASEVTKFMPRALGDAVDTLWDLKDVVPFEAQVKDMMDMIGAGVVLMEKGKLYDLIEERMGNVCHAGTKLAKLKYQTVFSLLHAAMGESAGFDELLDNIGELKELLEGGND